MTVAISCRTAASNESICDRKMLICSLSSMELITFCQAALVCVDRRLDRSANCGPCDISSFTALVASCIHPSTGSGVGGGGGGKGGVYRADNDVFR